ncbi:MAG: hypothetical protein Q8M02_14070 [Candidatus Didemnitutus sp.]|nr:hypothetical protein [Candidatus Didemnitutus sp.]
MGPGIVILFWLFVAALFSGIWVVSLVVFLISRKKDWRIVKWLSGAALGGTTFLGLLCLSLMGYGVIRATTPKYVFEETFGSKPSPQVFDIQSKVWWFADEGSTWLSFKADSATFESLVPKHLSRMSSEEYKKVAGYYSGELPTWWQPPLDESASEIYFFVQNGARASDSPARRL